MTTGHTLTVVRDKMVAEETPKVGDLVQLRGAYFNNATGVIVRRQYSWATMADAYVVRVDDRVTHHALSIEDVAASIRRNKMREFYGSTEGTITFVVYSSNPVLTV